MDKRYLLILLIVIVCCVNLSIIVTNSDVVGSASVSVGKYLFTIPEGFSLYQDTDNSVVIKNSDGMEIYFESNIGDSDTYDKLLSYIENKSDEKILSEGTLNIKNISVNTVYYQTINNTNKSAFYFEKYDTPFKIVISNFDYDSNHNLTLKYAILIIQSTRFDYKIGK